MEGASMHSGGRVIGLVNPGAMGSVIGAALAGTGHTVLWASEGRSGDSYARAKRAGLSDVVTMAELCAQADTVLSVCPPESASEVAAVVAAAGFDGLYIDANAVSPATARQVGRRFERCVDGGIVGPPPTAQGLTRLYLAGDEATSVAGWFAPTVVDARVVGGGVGAASAVKMCFAAWTKGTWALLLAIRALAEREGVSRALLEEWAISMPEVAERSARAAAATGPKAWRFEGEMHEIAASFSAADLPSQFHEGAAEVYRRLAPLKGTDGPDLAEALALLLDTAAE
jgi:3-hydroxyisobutyrate dehydrogenase-like beta-hydroxyacid dehydrogenase